MAREEHREAGSATDVGGREVALAPAGRRHRSSRARESPGATVVGPGSVRAWPALAFGANGCRGSRSLPLPGSPWDPRPPDKTGRPRAGKTGRYGRHLMRCPAAPGAGRHDQGRAPHQFEHGRGSYSPPASSGQRRRRPQQRIVEAVGVGPSRKASGVEEDAQ